MKKVLKKPKIVFISRYPIDFEVIPFQGFRKLIDELSLKYSIVYYTMGWSKDKDKKLRKGIQAKELPMKIDISNSLDKWIKTLLYYFLLPFLILKVKNEKPDLILLRENMPFVPLSFGVLKKPILIEIGDWWPSIIFGNTSSGKKIANFIENFEVHLWNKKNYFALIHNKAEEKLMIKKGLSKKQLKFVYQPMFGEGKYFPCSSKEERLKLGFTKNDFVVATHGILHKSKGYDQILFWWAKIIKKYSDWKFLFIGGTMGEKWFRKIIKDLKLENNVKITGWVSDQAKINKYLNCADCLLVTRRNSPDNFGTTPSGIPHSLMTGLPTIITGIPSVKEMIQDRKNGYIFKPDNFVSFNKCLEEIYNHPKKAKIVGLNGLRRAKEYFDPKKTAKQYIFLINKMISSEKVN